MILPYPQFCDYNNLKRIDATPEEHLSNLDKMASAVLEQRSVFLEQIANRCPHCGALEKWKAAE